MKVVPIVRRLGVAALLLWGTGAAAFAATTASSREVVVVPLSGPIDAGTARLVRRSVDVADARDAAAIVLDVGNAGGPFGPADAIRQALAAARVPVIAYIHGRADAGAALVALDADRIVVAPQASIGAAEPVPPTGASVAAIRSAFESAAQRTHRPSQLAAAMVDRSVDVPEYKDAGTILALDGEDAVRSNVAQAIAPTLASALDLSHLGGDTQLVQGYSWSEAAVRFLTSPAAGAILLALGLVGLLIEMQTLHGVAGAVAIGSLALFFGSHVLAGNAGPLAIALAVAGVVAILWELHIVPGHIVPGIIGVTCLLLGALLAFGLPFFFIAVETLATAIVIAAIVYSMLLKRLPENAWAHRLALGAAQGPDYVAAADLSALYGTTGTAASFLRPAGIASIGGRRVDVLTAGEFIAAGTPIRVVRVEGARVFVEAVTLPSYQ
jgi:membrane-bound serine protease (ClpP class)